MTATVTSFCKFVATQLELPVRQSFTALTEKSVGCVSLGPFLALKSSDNLELQTVAVRPAVVADEQVDRELPTVLPLAVAVVVAMEMRLVVKARTSASKSCILVLDMTRAGSCVVVVGPLRVLFCSFRFVFFDYKVFLQSKTVLILNVIMWVNNKKKNDNSKEGRKDAVVVETDLPRQLH